MRIRRVSEADSQAAELAQLRYEYGVARELLCRIVEQHKTVTFDSSEPVPPGQLKWESVRTEAGSQETTIWFVPEESNQSANNGGGNG